MGHRVISHFPNVAYNVVAIAASRGGLKAISQILSTLPPDFPAAILLVQHLSPKHPSQMAEILSHRTALHVKEAEEGELLRPGTVYIAVPNKHLLVNPDGTLSLSDGPKINFVRPAGDKLLASAAATFKSRAIGVVLTGGDGDGVLGVLAIKKFGGTVIVQDEASSESFSMPKSAISTGKVDFVLPLDAIAQCLVSLAMTQEVVSQELPPKWSNSSGGLTSAR
ncbi:chemotaxis protein CheB [Brasilonema octagenarum UFV-E1]|uniref:protein-glutamate methylesterase n=2 Tax=Brasilonema TaxID=383614 RepID=A0A856MPV1_9CYAN|nr:MULTISPECIES: chemotaxis protein CheB [Brasilonema]NMF67215.1 chemotaxis protein CheB [Brasilonema octagenarum UFV-OR1]QDL12130.1 chemotaxis protein CheB [Brasilonema sennae CENA114]QDL18509.1 chemotaxis protein CheB [Brasilonema octagenarum UFV-E1]